MRIRVLGWAGFLFLAAGLLILLFGPSEWRSFGCGALLTSVTVYGIGLYFVARQIATVRHRVADMLERTAQEMEKKKSS